MKVYSAKEVPKVVESILSLNVATMPSSDFLLTLARTIPEGVPALLKRTFHDRRAFPMIAEEAFSASSPNLIEPPELMATALLPGLATS